MSPAGLTLDLDRSGYQTGFLRVPVSTPRSPFGWTAVPVTSIRSGDGPCVVVLGGCHGDEYEGQIALCRLGHALRDQPIDGQVIILPALNAPAVQAGTRVSPLDNGNLYQAFTGALSGNPTGAIAQFIETALLVRASLVVDIHSGGSAVEYVPSAMISQLEDPARMQELVSLARVFALPITFVLDPDDHAPSSFLAACERAGVLALSAEIGGGGTVSPRTLRPLDAAIKRILHHVGVLRAAPEEPAPSVSLYRRRRVADTICAPSSGLFEPCVCVGDTVEVGQRAGWIHDITTPWNAPAEVTFDVAGLVLCRRLPAATQRGDGLFKLGVPWQGPQARVGQTVGTGSMKFKRAPVRANADAV